MSRRQELQAKTEEVVFEIITIRSILYKMERDSADNESLFVAMLNELGVRSPTGRELTLMGYRKMMERFDKDKLRVMVDKLIHDPIVVNLEV